MRHRFYQVQVCWSWCEDRQAGYGLLVRDSFLVHADEVDGRLLWQREGDAQRVVPLAQSPAIAGSPSIVASDWASASVSAG